MQENKFGQSGLRFKEIADNLLQPILKNKGPQETRWARAELRSIKTFLRNLPVIYNIQAEAIQECSDNFDATGQKEATNKLNQLADPSMISFAIGMCEILEDYSELSLAGQDLLMFPATVAEKCESFRTRLENLKENWVWRDKDLKLAGIGNPKKLIDNLIDGKYKCEVSQNVKIAAARRKKNNSMLNLLSIQKIFRSS